MTEDDHDWKDTLRESIRQWEARRQFGALDAAVLAGVADDLLEQAVVDFVLNFNVHADARLVALLERLPPGFATVYTTWALDGEIANGGFHQYFWNTNGAYVDLVKPALGRLQAAEHVQAFEQAVQLAAVHPPPDVEALAPRAQLEAFSESALAGRFDELDARWDELGDLGAARVRFMRQHPDLFAARLPLIARLRLALRTRFRSRP